MGVRDRRADDYIAKSVAFARPVLGHLRGNSHAACPDIAETLKWDIPFFISRGPACHMAAVGSHCASGFWKGERAIRTGATAPAAMGQLGHIRSREDLPPPRALATLVRKAVRLKGAGVPSPTRGKRAPRAAPRATFAALSPPGSASVRRVADRHEARRDAHPAPRAGNHLARRRRGATGVSLPESDCVEGAPYLDSPRVSGAAPTAQPMPVLPSAPLELVVQRARMANGRGMHRQACPSPFIGSGD
jgi:hypothetical protein